MDDIYYNTVEGYNPKDAGGAVTTTDMDNKVMWTTGKIQ
jgi:hypothetical protein